MPIRRTPPFHGGNRGSSPLGDAIAGIAQLVEHDLAKVGVASRMLDKDHPFRKAYPTEFPYFTDMGLDKNIARVEKLDEHLAVICAPPFTAVRTPTSSAANLPPSTPAVTEPCQPASS